MSKPNWSKDTEVYGGDIKDIPTPHIRKFPHKGVKRRVEVHIDSFVGVVAYARHWSARVDEEHNPIWNGKTWQKPNGDRDGYGADMHSPHFTNEQEARKWVRWALRAFDPKKYEFVLMNYEAYGKPPRWFYAHEGD